MVSFMLSGQHFEQNIAYLILKDILLNFGWCNLRLLLLIYRWGNLLVVAKEKRIMTFSSK
ncbi:UNVERIFIED_CONTAM: hypothetical protein Sindi_2867000, partial [Sesamum indicum]